MTQRRLSGEESTGSGVAGWYRRRRCHGWKIFSRKESSRGWVRRRRRENIVNGWIINATDTSRRRCEVLTAAAACTVEVSGRPVGVHVGPDDAFATGVQLTQERRDRQCRRCCRRRRSADPLDGRTLLGQQGVRTEIRRRSVQSARVQVAFLCAFNDQHNVNNESQSSQKLNWTQASDRYYSYLMLSIYCLST